MSPPVGVRKAERALIPWKYRGLVADPHRRENPAVKQLTRLSGFSVFAKVMFSSPVSSSWASWAPLTRGTRVTPEDVENPLQFSRLECLCWDYVECPCL